MRGLPPVPEPIARYELTFLTLGVPTTTGVWVFVPGLDVMEEFQIRDVLSEFVFYTTPLVANCCNAGTSLVRVALRPRGMAAGEVIEELLPTPGRWVGGQMIVACLVFHLLTADRRHSASAQIHLPGVPDVFADSVGRLTELGYGETRPRALDFVNGINAVTSPAGGRCVVGVVHRSRSGAPLAHAEFEPVLGVALAPRLGVLRRRRPIGR